MSPLHLLRARLQADETVIDFFQAAYQKEAKHFIGYKRSPSTIDYPYLAYVATKTTRTKGRISELKLSIVIGINEPGITGDVFDAETRLDEAEDLIVAALEPLRLDAVYSISAGEIITNHDLSMRHPYHEREIQLSIKRRAG